MVNTEYEVLYDFKSERWIVYRNSFPVRDFKLKEPAKKYARKAAENENAVFKSYAKEKPARLVYQKNYGA